MDRKWSTVEYATSCDFFFHFMYSKAQANGFL